MKGKEKDRDIFYITHSMEILVWLIIVLIIVGISTVSYMIKEKNDTNDYNIFMPDVDGLIVGSPVRMMGIEVGHIVKIKPTNENVYIKFIITNKDVSIPQGTKATVEFSGMAGSKSLELYLPDEDTYIDNTVPMLTVNPPKRLHDAFRLLNDMFHRLGDIIYNSSRFSNEIQKIEMPKPGSDSNIYDFIRQADNAIDDSTKRAEDLRRKLNDGNNKKQ